MISVKEVDFFYPSPNGEKKIKALDNVTINVQEGEQIALIGPNGSGKSTLGKLLNALLLPSKGLVKVDGMDTNDSKKTWDIRQKVGMVFQNPDNQIVATTVEEDVAFGPENLGVPPEEIRERIDEALAMVSMEPYYKRAPHTLSGGQKQRVAIAGVIAMRPKYLILDEPTAMLDLQGKKEVLSIVEYLKGKGITVVFITHFMEEAMLSDRIIALDKGAIVAEGSPKELFQRVELLREINLDVPSMTALAYELRKEGVPIPADLLNIEEMVKVLWPLLK